MTKPEDFKEPQVLTCLCDCNNTMQFMGWSNGSADVIISRAEPAESISIVFGREQLLKLLKWCADEISYPDREEDND